MKIAIISDVHGNLLALNSALVRIRDLGCDQIWCLGDNFGYFPDGELCFKLVNEHCSVVLMGNHEAMLLGHIKYSAADESVYRLTPIKKSLDNVSLNKISELPLSKIMVIDNNLKIFLSHGSPLDNLQGYIYPWDNLEHTLKRITEKFSEITSFVMGNSHRPLIYKDRLGTLMNVGSVGLPRETGSLGSFGLIEISSSCVQYSIERFELPLDNILKHYSKRVDSSVIYRLLH